jgi:hypothetical protein
LIPVYGIVGSSAWRSPTISTHAGRDDSANANAAAGLGMRQCSTSIVFTQRAMAGRIDHNCG